MAEDPGDFDLVTAYARGDQQAFVALYRRHRDRVFCLALGMLGDREAAADVSQEVFCGLVRTLSTFDGRAAFTTWLHRVTVNACYDHLRRRTPVPVPEPYAEVPAAEPVTESGREDALDVFAALAELGEDQRAVVVLHDMIGYSYDEVAQALDIAVGTVKSRLARGRHRLARRLSTEREHRRGVPTSEQDQ